MGPYVIRHSTNADYLSNLAAGPLDEYHLVFNRLEVEQVSQKGPNIPLSPARKW